MRVPRVLLLRLLMPDSCLWTAIARKDISQLHGCIFSFNSNSAGQDSVACRQATWQQHQADTGQLRADDGAGQYVGWVVMA
jgi:hypothetical protein